MRSPQQSPFNTAQRPSLAEFLERSCPLEPYVPAAATLPVTTRFAHVSTYLENLKTTDKRIEEIFLWAEAKRVKMQQFALPAWRLRKDLERLAADQHVDPQHEKTLSPSIQENLPPSLTPTP